MKFRDDDRLRDKDNVHAPRPTARRDSTTADVLPTLTKKVACKYIGQRAADTKQGKPFFLYLPLNAPHTPIAPTPEWLGKSGINPYADYVMETDWVVGQVLEALDKNGLADNTLVFFTSDNGCSPSAKFDEAGRPRVTTPAMSSAG